MAVSCYFKSLSGERRFVNIKREEECKLESCKKRAADCTIRAANKRPVSQERREEERVRVSETVTDSETVTVTVSVNFKVK